MVKRALMVLVVGAFLFSSCYATKVVAPPGKAVQLASKGSACTEVASKKQWYALWGLVALGSEDTSDLLQGVKAPVQVETKFTVVDYLLGMITGIVTIFPKTVKVYVCK